MSLTHAQPATPAPVRYGPHLRSTPQHMVDPLDFTLQPGGRWERLLRRLETGVLPIGDLVRATTPGHYSNKKERARVTRGLRCMARLGLVDHIPGWGWTATPHGVAELQKLNPYDDGARAHV